MKTSGVLEDLDVILRLYYEKLYNSTLFCSISGVRDIQRRGGENMN